MFLNPMPEIFKKLPNTFFSEVAFSKVQVDKRDKVLNETEGKATKHLSTRFNVEQPAR